MKILIDSQIFYDHKDPEKIDLESLVFVKELTEYLYLNSLEAYFLFNTKLEINFTSQITKIFNLQDKNKICWTPCFLDDDDYKSKSFFRNLNEKIFEATIAFYNFDYVIYSDPTYNELSNRISSLFHFNRLHKSIIFLDPNFALALNEKLDKTKTSKKTNFPRFLDLKAGDIYISKTLEAKKKLEKLDIDSLEEKFFFLDDFLISVDISKKISNSFFGNSIAKQKFFKKDIFLNLFRSEVSAVKSSPSPSFSFTKKKIAYLSPMPPDQSGISFYSESLIKELVLYYDIDIYTNNVSSENFFINEEFNIYPISSFPNKFDEYERIIYHFGNSPFHADIWSMHLSYPGIIVLHDFYLGHCQKFRQDNLIEVNSLNNDIFEVNGYLELRKYLENENSLDQLWNHPCNYSIFKDFRGVVIHSSYAFDLINKFYGKEAQEKSKIIPILKSNRPLSSRFDARKKLAISSEVFLVCSFGVLGPTKMCEEIICAWAEIAKEKMNSKFVFVGPCDELYKAELSKLISKHSLDSNILISGWIDEATYQDYLSSADLAIQLRSSSRGESSLSVLECLERGIPTIVNSHGSFVEIQKNCVYMIKEFPNDKDILEAITFLYNDKKLRSTLGLNGRSYVIKNHSPRNCARQYFDFIESRYESVDYKEILISDYINQSSSDKFDYLFASSIANSFRNLSSVRQIFLDISAVVQNDLRTGIQRYVRSILLDFLNRPLAGIRIEPIYILDGMSTYFYARKFTQSFLNFSNQALVDEPIDVNPGDIYLGLDLMTSSVSKNQKYFDQLNLMGCRIYFMLYDLLPVTNPEWFPTSEPPFFDAWLRTVSRYDGLVSISEETKNIYLTWSQKNKINVNDSFKIIVAPCGAEMSKSSPTRGFPFGSDLILKSLSDAPSFLMVGTVEPRKNHKKVIEAFSLLWDKNHDINLVIVGKKGWIIDETVKLIQSSKYLNKKLFFVENSSDEFLEVLYKASSCLIMASKGEGFGLPLIEAAINKTPIILNDIPILREVAQNFAFYYKDDSSDKLAKVIIEWLDLFKKNRHPKSEGMPFMSWNETANLIFDFIIKN